MKKSTSIFVVILAFVITAQSNIDKVTDKLVQLSAASYDNWHYTENHSLGIAELSKPAFDDSEFSIVKLDENIYPDSCWLRKVITLPEYIGGLPVRGKMKMLFEVTLEISFNILTSS